MNILIVDDELQIRRLVATGLSGYGYHVVQAANGQEALNAVAQRAPDAVILDLSLGTEPDGLEVCRRLREWSSVPILILSVKDDDRVKIAALDLGADDYLTKPFNMEELRARLQAVLRRTGNESSGTPGPAEIRAGALHIDLVHRRVTVDGEDVHLTPIEYDLLRLLATNPGKVITHRVILTKVWGDEYADMSHYVRVFVNQLRKKLRENPSRNVRYILNEPGIGYRFVDVE